jgi:hypothetical protein
MCDRHIQSEILYVRLMHLTWYDLCFGNTMQKTLCHNVKTMQKQNTSCKAFKKCWICDRFKLYSTVFILSGYLFTVLYLWYQLKCIWSFLVSDLKTLTLWWNCPISHSRPWLIIICFNKTWYSSGRKKSILCFP